MESDIEVPKAQPNNSDNISKLMMEKIYYKEQYQEAGNKASKLNSEIPDMQIILKNERECIKKQEICIACIYV